MAFKLATAFIDLTTRDSGLDRGLNQAKNSLNSQIGKLQSVAGSLLGGFSAGAFLGMTSAAASSADELRNRFAVAFGASAADAQKFSEQFAMTVNRGVISTMERMAEFQTLFVSMGFDESAAADTSKTLTTLTEDLSSFHDIASAEVSQKLISGLVGETEPLRKFGVQINAAILNQELLSMGIADGAKSATESQKAMARLAIIMRSTSVAQGDAAKTAGSFSNRVKGLQGAFQDFISQLGGPLNELFGPVIAGASQFLQQFVAIDKAMGGFPSVVIVSTVAVGGLTAAVFGLSVAFGGLGAAISAALTATGIGAIIVAVGVAIAGVIQGIRMLISWLSKFPEVVSAWERVVSAMKQLWSAFIGAISALWDSVKAILVTGFRALGAIFGIEVEGMDLSFVGLVTAVLNGIASMIESFANMFKLLTGWFEGFGITGRQIIASLLERTAAMMEMLAIVMGSIPGFSGRAFKTIAANIKAAADATRKEIDEIQSKQKREDKKTEDKKDSPAAKKGEQVSKLDAKQVGFTDLINQFQKMMLEQQTDKQIADNTARSAQSLSRMENSLATLANQSREGRGMLMATQ